MRKECQYGFLVSNPYKEKESRNLKGLLVTGDWRPGLEEFVRTEEIEALYFNVSMGWRGEDFSFLRGIQIKELSIITGDARGLDAISGLLRLEKLSLTASTKDKVDLSQLSHLRDSYLFWWSGLTGLGKLTGLRHLYLDKPSESAFGEVSALSGLETLTVANTPIKNLSLLPALKVLRKLELLDCRVLAVFEPIAHCRSLNWLSISGSKKLERLDFLKPLSGLEVLLLADNGKIDTLKPLENLKKLKAVAFDGSTVISDGDLQPLERLPLLAMLMFAPKRHYTHKLVKTWNWNNFNSPDQLLARVKPESA